MVTLAPIRSVSVSPEATLRLLLVSNSRFLRDALAAALDRDPRVLAVRCADATEIRCDPVSPPVPPPVSPPISPVDAVLLYAEHREDLACVSRLRDTMPGRAIITCGLSENEEDDAIATGVTGCIPNTVHLAQILPLVRGILRGRQPRARMERAAVMH